MWKRYCRLLLASLTVIVYAAEPDGWIEARNLYYAGVDGSRPAAEQASRLFEDIHARHPEDPAVMVYRGSMLLMEASWTFAPWRKGKLSKRGLKMMDRAVELAPSDLEVRFVRAATTSKLPGFFKRSQQAEQDFAWLAAKAPDAAKSGKLERRLAAASLYFHGAYREKKGDLVGAVEAWTAAVKAGPDTEPGLSAKKRLSE